MLLSGDFDTSDNWAIYVRTQYADVRNDELPLPDFYERLAIAAPRKSRRGADVTPPTAEPPPTVIDPEFAHEIANPPIPDTATLPTVPFSEQPPAAVGAGFIPPDSSSFPALYRRPAFISGLLVLITIVFAVIVLPALNRSSSATPTANVAVLPSNTTTATATVSPTDVLVLTATLTDVPLPTIAASGSLGQPGNPVTRNTDWTPQYQTFNGYEMALVPVGCFMMGSNDGQDNEKPVNQQCFDQPFWIDRYEVTNKQYGSEGTFKGDNRPRESLTWFQARNFCVARAAQLPTERQWEYAARGPSNLVYPWGNDFVDDNVVHSSNSNSQTADVGSRPAGNSWVGASDLSGNVWEWVSSIYQPYPYNADDGREVDSDRTYVLRVLHGGSWYVNEIDLRAADRYYYIPSITDYDVGIRCARSQ